MPLHERKCWECGNVAQHANNVTPEVLCKNCGSQDTRATKRPERPSVDIPQEWVKKYVDKLIDMAKQFDENSLMRTTCLMRAEHAMDLVKAFRESA